MAEGDRFEMAFRPGWRAAYRRTREGVAPPTEIADKLVTTLAKTLRESGGVPGFREMEGVAQNAAWRLTFQSNGAEDEAAILIESSNSLDRIVREQDGHRNTKVASGEAKSLIVQQGVSTTENGIWPVTGHFGEAACKALVDHYFFAIARQNLVAEGKLENHEQARQWQRGVEEASEPAIRQMAARLLKEPSAEVLRAPNRTVRPQSTRDLLGEDLVSAKKQGSSLGRRGR